jgi:ubiquinone/menaquinone biosynthesis C-methylase UbiE
MSATHEQAGSCASTATVQAWDKGAEGWNRNAAFIRAWLHEVTEGMLDAARIGPGSRVLDIAAGAGDQTLDIGHRVGPHGRVLATDISPRFLALARCNARSAGLRHVETRVADAQALGLAGADFDAAVCRLGLMFCRTPLAAFKEARAALKPGGRVSAVVFSRPRNNPCIAISMAIARKHAGLTVPLPDAAIEPGSLFSLGEPGLLARLLEAAGFAEIEVRPVSAPQRLASVRHYIDFVRTGATPIIEMLAALPARAQSDAWDDMEDQLSVFTTAAGWEGPNELLLCAATAPDPEIR